MKLSTSVVLILLTATSVRAFDDVQNPTWPGQTLSGRRLMIFGSNSSFNAIDPPKFDEAGGVLGRGLVFDSGRAADTPGLGLVMPRGKQWDYLGWRDKVVHEGHSIASWLRFELKATTRDASDIGSRDSNTYGMIGSIENLGSGTVKAFYGRASIGVEGTGGNAIAYSGGVTTRFGAGTTAGFQMTVDSMNRNTPVDYGFYLHANDYGRYGWGPLNYGYLAAQNVHLQQALIQGFAGGDGDALRWMSADGRTFLSRITRNGGGEFSSIAVGGSSGVNISPLDVLLPPNGKLSLSNNTSRFAVQATDRGNRIRFSINQSTDILSIDSSSNLGIAGQISQQGAKKAILLPNGSCPVGPVLDGGILCVENGVLKFRGRGQLVTIAGP